MRKDFCAFILTHGRPTQVQTARTLRKHGYTGKVFIVIDDEDETGEEYKRIYGDDVLVFSKDEVARYTDQFDNSPDRRGALWARNVCWDLARQQGYRYFIQLDDDYTHFSYRRGGRGHRLSLTTAEEYHSWTLRSLDAVIEAMVLLLEATPIKMIAFSQGGDHVGGNVAPRRRRFLRKAMNSFICDVERPIRFRGRLNEDVSTYIVLGGTGDLFFTDLEVYLGQRPTQQTAGGMTDVYLTAGTYVKSFYTVMAAPSCTSIGLMGNVHKRLHHHIDWNKAVPLIISQEFKKAVKV